MGQYYKTIIVSAKISDDNRIIYIDNDCNFKEGYIGLKLMEHSFLGNEWADAIAYLIYRNKVRMAEVGDYADEHPCYDLAYNNNVKRTCLDIENISNGFDTYKTYVDGAFIPFNYKSKYLINWDRKIYINFDEYIPLSKVDWGDNCSVSPFNLLTALGNGRGGGDYHESRPNYKYVGLWAWDVISIEDTPPADFTEYPIYFTD